MVRCKNDKCKKTLTCLQKIQLVQHPQGILFYLDLDRFGLSKISLGGNIKLKSVDGSECFYKLVGSCSHVGSHYGGHYCKQQGHAP